MADIKIMQAPNQANAERHNRAHGRRVEDAAQGEIRDRSDVIYLLFAVEEHVSKLSLHRVMDS